jgi:hypothetical protein
MSDDDGKSDEQARNVIATLHQLVWMHQFATEVFREIVNHFCGEIDKLEGEPYRFIEEYSSRFIQEMAEILMNLVKVESTKISRHLKE